MPERPEDYQERQVSIEGHPARLRTFRLGSLFYTSVDNVDPGGVLARVEGSTREEAEQRAIQEARREFLAYTHR